MFGSIDPEQTHADSMDFEGIAVDNARLPSDIIGAGATRQRHGDAVVKAPSAKRTLPLLRCANSQGRRDPRQHHDGRGQCRPSDQELRNATLHHGGAVIKDVEYVFKLASGGGITLRRTVSGR